MNIFIKAANHEHLLVVVHWVGSEELFGLLEGTVLAFDLICLGVVAEAVADPALVPTKYQYFTVVAASKRADSVSCAPCAIFVH